MYQYNVGLFLLAVDEDLAQTFSIMSWGVYNIHNSCQLSFFLINESKMYCI